MQEKINITGNNGINIATFLSIVALGIKFSKNWYMQQINNRILARQKITNQLMLLKSRIQPEFLFASLEALHHKISYDKYQSAEILLKLSELLSYMLYESNDDFAPVQRELFIIHEFIALENIMQNKKINFIDNIKNDISKKYIPSFTLLSLIQNCVLALQTNEHKETACFDLNINADNDMLYCTMHVHFENTATKKIYTDIINSFMNRLETLYKHNYRLEFSEAAKNKLIITLSLLLSGNLPVYKIEETSVRPYDYAAE